MLDNPDVKTARQDISEIFSRAPVPRPVRRDVISAAVERGLQNGGAGITVEGQILSHASKIAELARNDGAVEPCLKILLGLIDSYPKCERLQILAARLIEAATALAQGQVDREARTADAWAGIHGRFPQSVEPFRLTLRWILRRRGRDAATQALFTRFPTTPDDPAGLTLYAWGLHEIRNFAAADAAFERLMDLHGEEAAFLQFARSLSKRGEVWRACRVLDAGIERPGTAGRLRQLHTAAFSARARLEAFAPRATDGRASDAVLEEIFRRLAQTRRADRVRWSSGGIMMITGSLGAGGAERQFALTASALHAASRSSRRIADHSITGPVDVVCRSLKARPGGDFFAPALRDAGVTIREYAEMPSFAGQREESILAPYESALGFLPQPILEGMTHLADAIRAEAPHVVHIWQDGSIYAAGLAALAACVPRIVLNVRSLPPIDRPERYRPEYEVIFRGLLAAPGVRLTTNSQAAARRYAEWLDLDPQRVGVIYNGVDALPSDGTTTDQALAERFLTLTPDADFIVGTVMRLDENKRPFLWLDAAARIARRVPGARFIIVGDGPLREESVAYAARLGLSSRVLFVGRSPSVGFWLQQMDVFVLLSLVEGLPNVLIEAQHAGVPVITTDVGGAAETIVAQKTGLLLPPGENLDPESVAACILRLRDAPDRRRAMGVAARHWAGETFSIATMMDRTVRTFLD